MQIEQGLSVRFNVFSTSTFGAAQQTQKLDTVSSILMNLKTNNLKTKINTRIEEAKIHQNESNNKGLIERVEFPILQTVNNFFFISFV
jgi:hypothetical protein